MIRRNTWIILGIFVVLLAVVLLTQREQENTAAQSTATPEAAALIDIGEGVITSLAIENTEGRRVLVGRDAEGMWALEEPEAEATDVAQVESAVTQLLSLEAEATLDDAPPPEATGLAQPAYTIVLNTSGQTINVQVGKLTPIENGYYVQKEGGPVMVVSKYGLESVLNLFTDPPIQVTPTPTVEIEPAGEVVETPTP